MEIQNKILKDSKQNTFNRHMTETETDIQKYVREFMIDCVNTAKNMKGDKHSMDREYINRYKFKTRNSNDITYKLITIAEKTIDREFGRIQLLKYVNRQITADQIEMGIFEFTLIHVIVNNIPNHFVVNIYHDKLNDLCDNLNINDERINNKTLINTVLSNGFNPYFTAFLPPELLHPANWANVIERIKLREKVANEIQTTDIYKCAKCHERKFKIYELQLRCADEPSSKICMCVVCGHVFIK